MILMWCQTQSQSLSIENKYYLAPALPDCEVTNVSGRISLCQIGEAWDSN